jgi:hypothetical protein
MTREQTLSDGTKMTNQQQTKVYRDSFGRVRSETTHQRPDGTTETSISIFDPVAGVSYALRPAAKTADKIVLPSQTQTGWHMDRGQWARNSNSTNAPQRVTTDLGQSVVNGLAATGTKMTETIPAGAIGNNQAIQITRTTWISTDLKVPVQITTSDPRNGTSTLNLTNIVRSEPDASLFSVPSDYTVNTRTSPARAMGRGGRPGPQ